MIDISPNIDAYFEEVVQDAMEAKKVDATEAAKQYLAGLLSDYARVEHFQEAMESPLTFQLRDALSTRGPERFGRLRALGDAVLYVVGFFGSGVSHRGADRGYVLQVGASAYSHAATMLRMGGGAAEHDVLGELSEKYAGFVEVVTEVADGAMVSGKGDVSALRLYERWEQTGSTRLAEALGELGMCPVAVSEEVH